MAALLNRAAARRTSANPATASAVPSAIARAAAAASAIPLFIPRAPNGGNRWAASPTSSTRRCGSLNEAATLRRKRYVDTHRIRSAYPSPTTAGSHSRTASSVPYASCASSSRHCRSTWKPR